MKWNPQDLSFVLGFAALVYGSSFIGPAWPWMIGGGLVVSLTIVGRLVRG